MLSSLLAQNRQASRQDFSLQREGKWEDFIYLFVKEQVELSDQISQLVAGIKMFFQLRFKGMRSLVSNAETSPYLHSSHYISYIESILIILS